MAKEIILPENPFKPGVGQKPPYLAGREEEKKKFRELLDQKVVMQNLIVTGLRGIGKSALLEELKPDAYASGWVWAGSMLSESASDSEDAIAVRVLLDLSVLTSNLLSLTKEGAGFARGEDVQRLDYPAIEQFYKSQPGLVADKLKATLEYIGNGLKTIKDFKGVVFAYDEAQFMTDQGKRRQYPLSVLLDVFQSLQAKGFPFLLVFAGLPTLYPKIRETRGYAERMFTVCTLKNLSEEEAIKAIKIPIEQKGSLMSFTDTSMKLIAKTSGGYPFFIQFICRDTFDSFLVQLASGITEPSVPIAEIRAKLDTDFFAPKWSVLTEREMQLLALVAKLPNREGEFSIKEIVDRGKEMLDNPLSDAYTGQLLIKLEDDGLVFKTNRHGKYSLGVPMLADYINRQEVLMS